MDAAQQAFQHDLAIMVYHYLLEWRMESVAQQFAASCPVLVSDENFAQNGLMSIIPYRRLHDAMFEYSELLDSMRRTIQMYHTEVPIPFGATSWDKIKFIIDYFYIKGSVDGTDGGGNINPGIVFTTQPTPSTSTSAATAGAVADAGSIYHLVQVAQTPAELSNPSLEPGGQNPPAVPGTSNAPEQSTAGQPVFMYLASNAGQELKNGTFLITMGDSNNQAPLGDAIQSSANFLTLDDAVAVGQQIDLSAMIGKQPSPHLPAISLPSITIIDDHTGHTTTKEEVANPQDLCPEPENNAQPEPEMSCAALPSLPVLEAEDQPTVEERQQEDALVTSSKELLLPTDGNAEQGEAPPAPELPAAQQKAVDPDALKEWQQIRGVTMQNLDNHIRQLNYEAELKQLQEQAAKRTNAELRSKLTQSDATDSSPSVQLAIFRTVETRATKPKRGRKKKRAGKVAAKGGQSTVAELPQQARLDDSESSDFASSADEDADVRKMFESVKQYRKQKKRLAAKENEAEAAAASSNVQCEPCASFATGRMLFAAGHAPHKSTVKRSLRNRSPSSSSVSTPERKQAKRSPTVPDSNNATTVVPSAATNRRVGLTKSAKKSNLTPADGTQPPPALAPLSPKNRRPVRACTMNRKLNASTPLKQPVVPARHGENLPPPGTVGTPEPEKHDDGKPDPVEENSSTGSDTVAVGEEAIYAVLAKLHGDT
ncbi:uncharacterized protein LOC118505792 [Anopheles stephensi]|uniref:uncharacterized protein LOC118505792 n=1 Tax=Anopheles stephensi TaxID=30069 RepID=UPI0007D41377|nr:uncharacterized protein LOC118505792 [Anopheles stephensi]XP_035898029.1 uncharacterized protein LOC118505792 [Anopheles stephensi]